jgi:UDP-N-acetylglucosamine 2-epimerase (non-hydrolysing)
MKILHVVGARPNFMKAAPVMRALSAHRNLQQVLVHTGQHYSRNMSDVFLEELGIPAPDVNLEVGSGTHAQQTSQIMSRFEPVLLEHNPDVTVVYGDVNSTVAVALVCAKLDRRIAHVEAGLRSFDRTMPEEINRLVTDQLADVLFTPSADGDENLVREGVPADRIHRVGNVMIDSLVRLLPMAEHRFLSLRQKLSLQRYGLVTLHRPSNVDDIDQLRPILVTLDELGRQLPLVFPIHPRTLKNLNHDGGTLTANLIVTEPLPYLDFLALQQRATVVITDSGGIQEETTYLGVPCLTVRENTERPVTVTQGTNILVGRDMDRLRREILEILGGRAKQGTIPELWDGHASERIAAVLTGTTAQVSTSA